MSKRTRTITYASIGAAAIVAVIAIILAAALTRPSDPQATGTVGPTGTAQPTPPSTAQPTPPSTPDPSPETSGSDAEAHGWIAEPATTDIDEYAEAALLAIATFDSTKATRDEFIAYLESWMSPVPNDTTGEVTERNLSILKHDIVMPEDQWDYVTRVRSVVTATAPDGITQTDKRTDRQDAGYMAVLSIVVTPDDESEDPWMENRRILVSVECSDRVIPNEAIGQKPGDCKVVRWADGD